MTRRSPSRVFNNMTSTTLKFLFLFLSLSIHHIDCFSSNPHFTSLHIRQQQRHLIHPLSSRSFTRLPPSRTLQATLEEEENPPADIVVAETSLALKRVSWLSWWCQVILTVTSSVSLGFAKNVLTGARDAQVNFFFAGTGIVVSFMSIFWTWGGGARLSRRLLRRPTSRIQAANMLRRAIDVGVTLNLIGMFLTIIGAEQTVGVLAIKVMTARPWNGPAGGMPMVMPGLQPLDVLIVQANTNTLLSHFCSLAALLYLVRFVKKLDPPSEEEE